jgi:hypothetical protein
VECFIAFVALVMLFTAVVVAAAIAQTRADRHNQAFYLLAQRFSGVCQPAGWFRSGSVRFRYGQTHAVLYSYSGGSGGPSTLLQVEWPEDHLSFEIVPRFLEEKPAESITTGSESFDSYFAVRTADARHVRAWLSTGVRWQIDRLRFFAEPGQIEVALSRGRLTVKKQGRLTRFDELEQFCRLVLELYDQAMLTRSVGIEFVESDEVQPIHEAICQVCGENIASEMVVCRRCKTPHHQDCWQYYGACSTYGCRETVFIAPRVAAAVDSDSVRPNRPR